MTIKEIAAYGVRGDFNSAASETLGIAKITGWIEELIAAEREECAKILELEAKRYGSGFPALIERKIEELLLTLAMKIRARSNADSTAPEVR